MSQAITIRPYEEPDAPAVQALFALVNRQLAPAGMHDAFEAYIARSMTEEMGRIGAYYRERNGGFWVALRDRAIAGMFGLECTSSDAMELRRMAVDPSFRRAGIARSMLSFAEAECQRIGARRLELSTSELQQAALEFVPEHRLSAAGCEETADSISNKTVGGGNPSLLLREEFLNEPGH